MPAADISVFSSLDDYCSLVVFEGCRLLALFAKHICSTLVNKSISRLETQGYRKQTNNKLIDQGEQIRNPAKLDQLRILVDVDFENNYELCLGEGCFSEFGETWNKEPFETNDH